MNNRYNPDDYPGWWFLPAMVIPVALLLFAGTLVDKHDELMEQKNLNGSVPAFVREA